MSDYFSAGSTNSSTLLNSSSTTDIGFRNYSLYFKFFKQHYVAPWGRYFVLGITLNTRKAIYDSSEMSVYYNDPKRSGAILRFNDFGPAEQKFKYPDILMGAGNSRIIADRIILDYGYNINIVAFTITLVDAFDMSRLRKNIFKQILVCVEEV